MRHCAPAVCDKIYQVKHTYCTQECTIHDTVLICENKLTSVCLSCLSQTIRSCKFRIEINSIHDTIIFPSLIHTQFRPRSDEEQEEDPKYVTSANDLMTLGKIHCTTSDNCAHVRHGW